VQKIERNGKLSSHNYGLTLTPGLFSYWAPIAPISSSHEEEENAQQWV